MRPFTNPIQTVKNLQRFQQILNVLLKHGFGSILQELRLTPPVSLQEKLYQLRLRKGPPQKPPETHAQRLRMAFEELGPSFVKFGQILSTRPDLVPADLVAEFRQLQDNVAPLPFSTVRQVIEHEFRQPLGEIFALFEEEPIASASIAQVHFATLQSGPEVVVKVQRPGIDRIILADTNLLFYGAELIERYIADAKRYAPTTLVEEFSRTIHRELDFIQEASSTEQFNRIFHDDPMVVAPRIYWELSTQRVLTQQRLYGFPIDQYDRIDAMGIDRRDLAVRATQIFMREVLDYGFFHADPHPGNIFILETGAIGVIDFGLVGRVDRELRETLINIIFSIITKDYDRIVRQLISFGIIPESVDQRGMKRDLMNVVEPYYGQPLKNVRVGPIVQEILDMIVRYDARIPGDLLTLARTLVIVEGIGRGLDPDLDLLGIGTPFLTRLFRDRFSPARLAHDTFRASEDIAELVRALPDQTRLILRKTLRDELTFVSQIKGLEPLGYEVDRLGNRVALALIVSSLIIGSTTLLETNTSATWSLGFVGLAAAAVVGLWLAVMIIRQGKY